MKIQRVGIWSPLSVGAMFLMVAVIGSAQDHSVGGLSLGMSSSQVKAKLGSGYSEMLQSIAAQPGEAVSSVLQHRPPTQDATRDAYALVYVDDHLISVQHEVIYGRNDPQKPNHDQTIADLKAKFGPTTPTEFSPFTILGWSSKDSSGKPSVWCVGGRNYGIQAFPELERVTEVLPNCGISTRAEIEQGAIIGRFHLWTYDSEKYYNALSRENKRMSQQQQNTIDKAKQNRAPL